MLENVNLTPAQLIYLGVIGTAIAYILGSGVNYMVKALSGKTPDAN